MKLDKMLDGFEIFLWALVGTGLSMGLGMLFSIPGSFAGYLVAFFIVGYRVDEDIINGAVHGFAAALTAGLLSTALMISMGTFFSLGPGSEVMEFGYTGIIIGILIDTMVGTVAGAAGSALKLRSYGFPSK